jgi:hypothetical protein
LLGGEPAWQLLHGLPFAIAGVACVFDVENVSTANVSKTSAAAPTNPLTIANMIAFGYCIVISSLSLLRKPFPGRTDHNGMAAPSNVRITGVYASRAAGGVTGISEITSKTGISLPRDNRRFGQSRHYRDVRVASGSPPTPDIRYRSNV